MTDLERPDHYYLGPDDECFYFGAYQSGLRTTHSRTHSVVNNLKKAPAVRHTPQWQYKLNDIRNVGQALRSNISAAALASSIFVPVPPSKRRDDPAFDDRMTQVARAIGAGVDVREIIELCESRESFHTSSERRDPDALERKLRIVDSLCVGSPSHIFVLDDMLTTGCSFTVCKRLLMPHFPGASILGLFVARRVPPAIENYFEDLSL